MIKYANDIELTGLLRSLTNMHRILNEDTTNGRLDHAFLVAHDMEARLDQIKRRLNEIKFTSSSGEPVK